MQNITFDIINSALEELKAETPIKNVTDFAAAIIGEAITELKMESNSTPRIVSPANLDEFTLGIIHDALKDVSKEMKIEKTPGKSQKGPQIPKNSEAIMDITSSKPAYKDDYGLLKFAHEKTLQMWKRDKELTQKLTQQAQDVKNIIQQAFNALNLSINIDDEFGIAGHLKDLLESRSGQSSIEKTHLREPDSAPIAAIDSKKEVSHSHMLFPSSISQNGSKNSLLDASPPSRTGSKHNLLDASLHSRAKSKNTISFDNILMAAAQEKKLKEEDANGNKEHSLHTLPEPDKILVSAISSIIANAKPVDSIESFGQSLNIKSKNTKLSQSSFNLESFNSNGNELSFSTEKKTADSNMESSIKKLVDKLEESATFDLKFLRAFLLSYPLFMTSHRLMDMIAERFRAYSDPTSPQVVR